MPRILYEGRNFRDDTLAVIAEANVICHDYQAQGYGLTLRQLYYQFVARDLLPNNDRSYKRLGSIINDARLAGMLDWEHISDRTRSLRTTNTWSDPSQIITASAAQFKRDLWSVSGQENRPEVWVEKDALVDVVERACRATQTPHFSCRGYVSQSEMWRAGRRMVEHLDEGFTPIVFHLGDHDPSGIDMTRDITDRLSMFAEEPVQVIRIALTMDQINQYQPPPNPTKMTDSRGSDYVSKYGYQSWELDALEPAMLVELIQENLGACINDQWAWDDILQEDTDTRARMGDVAAHWDLIATRWDDVRDLLDD